MLFSETVLQNTLHNIGYWRKKFFDSNIIHFSAEIAFENSKTSRWKMTSFHKTGHKRFPIFFFLWFPENENDTKLKILTSQTYINKFFGMSNFVLIHLQMTMFAAWLLECVLPTMDKLLLVPLHHHYDSLDKTTYMNVTLDLSQMFVHI